MEEFDIKKQVSSEGDEPVFLQVVYWAWALFCINAEIGSQHLPLSGKAKSLTEAKEKALTRLECLAAAVRKLDLVDWVKDIV